METIGKVLCITLLTVFGSAAATVYIVDSDILPSYLDKPTPVYTSDVKEQEKPADFQNATYSRERERINYADAEEESYEAEEYSDVKPIWGQSYDSHPAAPLRSEERARELAQNNSLDSIIQNIDYWSDQYSNAVSSGRQASADNALRNYSEYKKALDIKQSGQ
ncbi:MAG: hypothetical protein AB1598_11050 [Thermodesulfobacteriota bacterium]